MKKRAILVVSFGTSYKETREKTIAAIENSLQEAFSEYKVYRAFTSKRIKRKLEREGVFIFDVKEALEQMLPDGVAELMVQPTYMINGMEYDKMIDDIAPYLDKFENVIYGSPLLSGQEDYKELATIIRKAYPVDQDEVLVLMGHGSDHHANIAYPVFERVLKELDYQNIVVGTVKGYPTFFEVKRQLKKSKIQKVCLVPMMIVAGNHANYDMIGKEESWKAELEQEGYRVRYYLKGLGELSDVQQMFVRHAKEANPLLRKTFLS